MHWHSVQTSYRYRLVSKISTYPQFHWEYPEPQLCPFSPSGHQSPFFSLLCGLLYPDLSLIIGLIFTSKTTRNLVLLAGTSSNDFWRMDRKLSTWNSWVLLVWICAQNLNPTSRCCGWRITEDLMMNLFCSGYFVSCKELIIPWSMVLNYPFPAIYFPSSLA